MKMRIWKKKCALLPVMLSAAGFILTGCADPVEEGTELLKTKDYAGAIELFQKAAENEKNPGEAYRGLGICYWEQKEYEKAKKAFGQALDHGAKESATIYNLLGLCAMKTEQPEKAVYYFEEGQNFPDAKEELLQEMSFNLVCAYEKVGDWKNAKEKFGDLCKAVSGG